MIFSYAPILFADISSLVFNYKIFKWGTQLYICMLETGGITTYIFILTIIEFFRLNKLIRVEEPYKMVKSDSNDSIKGISFYNDNIGNELERKLREDMLRKIMC